MLERAQPRSVRVVAGGEPKACNIERRLLAVARECTPGSERVKVRNGVGPSSHRCGDAPDELRRVAQTTKHRSRRRCIERSQERSETHGQWVVRIPSGLNDREVVRLELRQQLCEDSSLDRQPERLGWMRAEQQLRELPHPVGGEPAADPLRRDEAPGLGVG